MCATFWVGVYAKQRLELCKKPSSAAAGSASPDASPDASPATTNRIKPLSGFVASLMVLFYTLFPSVLNRVALTLSCRTFHDRSLLTEALSIRCGSKQHIVIITTVGIPGMLIFALVIPATIALLLFRQRRKQTLYPSQVHYQSMWTVRFGFMFAGYEIGYEWWESVVMLRKCAFVMLAVFLRQYGAGKLVFFKFYRTWCTRSIRLHSFLLLIFLMLIKLSAAQVTAASLVLIAALSLHLQYQPFADDGLDLLESFGLHACLLMLLTALLCNMLSIDTERDSLDISEFQKKSELGPKSTLVMIVVVFFSTLSFFVVAARGTILSSQEEGMTSVINRIARCCAREFPLACKRRSQASVSRGGNRDRNRLNNTAQVHPRSQIQRKMTGEIESDAEAFSELMNQMLEEFVSAQKNQKSPHDEKKRVHRGGSGLGESGRTAVEKSTAVAKPLVRRTSRRMSQNSHGTIRGSLKYNAKVALVLKKSLDSSVAYNESLAERKRAVDENQKDSKRRLSARLLGRTKNSNNGEKEEKKEKKEMMTAELKLPKKSTIRLAAPLPAEIKLASSSSEENQRKEKFDISISTKRRSPGRLDRSSPQASSAEKKQTQAPSRDDDDGKETTQVSRSSEQKQTEEVVEVEEVEKEEVTSVNPDTLVDDEILDKVAGVCVALTEKCINFDNFQQVFLKLDKDQSGKWSWKMFKKLVKKADKSAELDVTKLLWDELLLTADVEKNQSIWNFLVSKKPRA